jgi:dihydroneopterin aldolase
VNKDRVFIRDLKLAAVIGVYPWERELRQNLVLNLELATDIRAAAARDDLALTHDYKAISDRLTRYAAGSEFQLLESLAEGMAAILMAEFGISWLRLGLDKPGAIVAAGTVGVLIERGQPGDGCS